MTEAEVSRVLECEIPDIQLSFFYPITIKEMRSVSSISCKKFNSNLNWGTSFPKPLCYFRNMDPKRDYWKLNLIYYSFDSYHW